jgi:hypothetical protein
MVAVARLESVNVDRLRLKTKNIMKKNATV